MFFNIFDKYFINDPGLSRLIYWSQVLYAQTQRNSNQRLFCRGIVFSEDLWFQMLQYEDCQNQNRDLPNLPARYKTTRSIYTFSRSFQRFKNTFLLVYES